MIGKSYWVNNINSHRLFKNQPTEKPSSKYIYVKHKKPHIKCYVIVCIANYMYKVSISTLKTKNMK